MRSRSIVSAGWPVARAISQPTHVGVGRAVAEGLAVITLLAQRLQEFVGRCRAGVAGRPGQEPHGTRVRQEFRLRIAVVLRVVDRSRHVQHLLHGRVAKAAGSQLGDVLRHRGGRIEPALVDQHRRQRAEEGLGHRKSDVRPLGGQRAEVALVDDAPAVQHDDAVGVVDGQRLAPGHRYARACRHEAQRVDVIALSARQRADRAGAMRDVPRRKDFPPVRERPPRLRESVVTAVLEADPALHRRGRADHPLQDHGVGRRGVRHPGRQCRSGQRACQGQASAHAPQRRDPPRPADGLAVGSRTYCSLDHDEFPRDDSSAASLHREVPGLCKAQAGLTRRGCGAGASNQRARASSSVISSTSGPSPNRGRGRPLTK